MAYLGCAEQEVGTVWRRKRNNLRQRAVSSAEERSREHRPAAVYVRAGTESTPLGRGAPRRNGVLLAQVPTPLRADYANLFDDEGGEGSSLARGGRKNWLRLLRPPRPARRAGLREDGQARPRCAADADRTEAGEDLTPSERRHSDLRQREHHMIASKCGRKGEQPPQCGTQGQTTGSRRTAI